MNQQSKWAKVLSQLSDETLSKTDSAVFKQYKKSLKEIKIEVKRYIKEYDQLSFSKRLEAERLLNVGAKIDSILKENNKQVTQFIKDGSKQHAINGYQGTFYALEGANKLNLSMSILNADYIESLVNKPVSGKRFSTRLYQNTKRLAKTTTQSLIQGAIDGKGYAYVAKRITDQTEADYRRAMRIARTEGGRVQSETTQRAYVEVQEQGVNLQKQWLASLDDKTRSSHASLDGTTIDVDDYFESSETGAQALGPRMFGAPGEDINCRCTTISIVDGYKPSLRYDKEIGKPIENMSYNEWLDYKTTRVYNEDALIGLKGKDITITGISEHALKRLVERNVSAGDVMKAIERPIRIGGVKKNKQGLESVLYVGEKASVAVNPKTGNITTTYKTHRKVAKKLRGR